MDVAISSVDDRDLVARALSGEQSAVGEMYDRYADSIYSFCRSRLRNEADAADATQDTFVLAATRLSQLREPAKLRSWLYAIARNQVIASGKIAARAAGGDGMEFLVAPDADPDIDLLRVEAAAQLWDAADGLSDRDQEVLELHLRHGLVGQGLADALDVTESHANVLLSRMRDRIATSLGGLLVARQGREDCYELDMLLASWDGRFTLDVRSRVSRHVKACEVCERTHATALASGVSFGILPIMTVPGGLREQTVGLMSQGLGVAAPAPGPGTVGRIGFAPPAPDRRGGSGTWDWQPNGFPGAAVADRASRGVILLTSAAAFALLLILAGGVAWIFRDSNTVASVEVAGSIELPSTEQAQVFAPTTGDSQVPTTVGSAGGAGPTGTTASTSAAAEEPASTTGVDSTTTSTEAPTTTVVATTAAVPTTAAPTTVAPTTAAPTTTSTSSTSTTSTTTTTTTLPPNVSPVFNRAAARPGVVQVDQGSCPGQRATIVVDAEDPDGEVDSVVVIWSQAGDAKTTTSLQRTRGGLWIGEIGTWFVSGSQSSQVVATDNSGDSTATFVTVRVTPCPPG